MAKEAASLLFDMASAGLHTPPPISRIRPLLHNTPDQISSQRQFVMTGVKRQRDDLLTVFYESGEDTVVVPLFQGEDEDIFIARREKATSLLYDANRKEVYCTWQKSIISINVTDDWQKIRETFREQRFMYKGLQLVVLRFTCGKSKKGEGTCLNCSKPSRRMQCMTPTFYYYVMPLPISQVTTRSCDKDLLNFNPIRVDREDTTEWEVRLPSCHVHPK